MTKLNIGLISLGAFATIFASGLGIYKSLNKSDNSLLEQNNSVEIEKEVLDFENQELLLEIPKEENIKKTKLDEELEINSIERESPIKKENIPQVLPIEIKDTVPKEKIVEDVVSEKVISRPNYNNSFDSFSSSLSNLGFNTNNFLEGMQPGTIGSRFSQYFMGDINDPDWNKKVNNWKTTYRDINHRKNLPSSFKPSKESSLSKLFLMTRCRAAYRKNNWRDGLKGKGLIISQYWAAVAYLCGKEGVQMPDEWYQYLNY